MVAVPGVLPVVPVLVSVSVSVVVLLSCPLVPVVVSSRGDLSAPLG